jgi:hypothetical protein
MSSYCSLGDLQLILERGGISFGVLNEQRNRKTNGAGVSLLRCLRVRLCIVAYWVRGAGEFFNWADAGHYAADGARQFDGHINIGYAD